MKLDCGRAHTLSNDYVVNSCETPVVLDKSHDEVFLVFLIDQVTVSLSVPSHRLDIVDVKVHCVMVSVETRSGIVTWGLTPQL